MVMNILYLGHFDNTGYGQAAQGYVNALLKNKYNVICRHIPLNGPPSNDLPFGIKNCLNKSVVSCDYVIQHTLPVYWQYSPNFKKNIGLFVYESDSLIGTGWENKIGMMDVIITANNNTLNLCKNINNNSYLIPHAFDIDKYHMNYISTKLKLPNSFKFYTIGEFTARKNLEAIIRSFHSTFNHADNVDLVIKTNRSGVKPELLRDKVKNFCKEIKTKMKLYGNSLYYYKEEIIITEYLTEKDIYCLHQNCQVFVNTSLGEGFSIPTFDAYAFRKPIIHVGNSYDYLKTYCSDKDYFYGNTDSINNLYTGKHKGFTTNISTISKRMKNIYENYEKYNNIKNDIEEFSYEKIGNLFNAILV